VPVFVIGLRDSGFPSRARASLGRLAATTGGRGYFLGDPAMLDMTLDYVGALVGGSYAIQFADPEAESADLRSVKVEVGPRGWEVHAPSKVR
jgi:hypothetical protein